MGTRAGSLWSQLCAKAGDQSVRPGRLHRRIYRVDNCCLARSKEGKAVVTSLSLSEQAFLDVSAWKLHVDGASNMNGSGAGLILVSPEGEKTSYALSFNFKATNNESAYVALIVELKLTEELEVNVLEVFSDSILVANQVTSTFKEKNDRLVMYVQLAKCLLGQFKSVRVTQVARAENAKVDALTRLVSGIDRNEGMSVPIEELLAPSIERTEVAEFTPAEPT